MKTALSYRNHLSAIFSLSSNAMILAKILKWNLLLYEWWWIIINSKKLLFIKAKNVMWWWFLFNCVLLFKRTLLSLSNRKAEKYSWGRKSDKLFLLKVNFQLYSILLLLESIYFAFYKFLQQWVYSFKGNCAWKLTRPTHLHQQINMYWDL